MKFTIGILGGSRIAQKYSISSFLDCPLVEKIYVASRSNDKASEIAQKFGIAFEQSYESLIENRNIDVIYISLPIPLHVPWIIKAAKAKKHVICEKSLSNNYDEVVHAVQICKDEGVYLFENFMCEFHVQHQEIQSKLKELGTIFLFESKFGFPKVLNSSHNNDALYDIGCYPVFMARNYFGEPTATTAHLLYENNMVERGSIIFEFDNKSALLSFGYGLSYQNNYALWTQQGVIKTHRAFSIPPDTVPIITLKKNVNNQDILEEISCKPINQFTKAFTHYLSSIKQKKNEHFSNILLQAKALYAVKESARLKKRVVLSSL